MKAILTPRYGSPEVFELREVEKPVPKEKELLIKVHTVAINPEDCQLRSGDLFFTRLFNGIRKPRNPILGNEFSGVVVSTGSGVGLFKEGDKVFGTTGTSFGCYAEYVCMPETGMLAIKPESISHEEAARVCGVLAVWNFLKDNARIQMGQKVLINGASGSVGSSAVQLAKHFGAEVTGVCSTDNIEFVKSLGSDEVIDYMEEDFTKSQRTYDIIFDVVGNSSFSRCRGVLANDGIYLKTVLGLPILIQTLWTSIFNRQKAIFSATGLHSVPTRLGFLAQISKLIDSGKLKTIVDRKYRLMRIAEAHRFVEKGHRRGNVIISVA